MNLGSNMSNYYHGLRPDDHRIVFDPAEYV